MTRSFDLIVEGLLLAIVIMMGTMEDIRRCSIKISKVSFWRMRLGQMDGSTKHRTFTQQIAAHFLFEAES